MLWLATASQNLAVEAQDDAALGLAQPDRVLGQRLEDRLEIERGPPDHLEQLAGRRLLLERDPSSLLRASSSVNRRTFSMAITAWSAKVWSSSTWPSVNGPARAARRRSRRWGRPPAASARPSRLRQPRIGAAMLAAVLRIGRDVLDVDDAHGPGSRAPITLPRSAASGTRARSAASASGRLTVVRPTRWISSPSNRYRARCRSASHSCTRALHDRRRTPAARRSASC